MPSPIGFIPVGGVELGPCGIKTDEFTGKVEAVIYDRFGDFEGFILLTESGHEHRFNATEAEIEQLVRFAWIDRVVISVVIREGDPKHRPVTILLRRSPSRPRE
jgi:hypothetical protein